MLIKDHITYIVFCRVCLVHNSCPSNLKKRKRPLNSDTSQHAVFETSADSVDQTTHDVEISTSLMNTDHTQHCDVKEKKKKKKVHNKNGHGDSQSMENVPGTAPPSAESELKLGAQCEEASDNYWLSTPQNLDTSVEKKMDNDIASVSQAVEIQAGESVVHTFGLQPQMTADSRSVTASLSPVNSPANESCFANDGQQVEVSRSAKRRRRHRRRNAQIKCDGDVPSDEHDNKVPVSNGSSLNCQSVSNMPSATSHFIASGLGRTHIVFDDPNNDCESSVETQPVTGPTCNEYDGTFRSPSHGCDTAVAKDTVNVNSNVKKVSHLHHDSSASSGLICSDVTKEYSETPMQCGTKVRHPPKNARFANVQVFSRQRVKKISSTTCVPSEASNTITALPSKQATILHIMSSVFED